MITDHIKATKPPQTLSCPPFREIGLRTLNSSAPYFVNASLNAALAIPTAFANLLVLLAMRRVSSIRLPSKLLLCSLVLTDLGAGLVVLPQHAAFFMKRSNPDVGICSLNYSFGFSGSMFGCASLLTLTAISLDRYAALFFHLKYQQTVTTRRVCVVLGFIWLDALFFASTLLWNSSLWFVLSILGSVTTFPVISVTYIKIYRRLRSQDLQPHDEAQQQARNTLNMERYRRTASAMMWVYVLFVVCYLPYFCGSGVALSEWALRHAALIDCIREFTHTLVLLNSCLNPFVYCLRLPEVRTEVNKQLRKLCCRSS